MRSHRQIPQNCKLLPGNCARRAAATVELAICLPLLIMLTFGAVESSNMIFTKQAVTAAAYEGVRIAIRPNGSTSDTQTRIQEVITARRVNGIQTSIAPAEVGSLPRGTPISVTVTADCDVNTVGPSWYFTGRTLTVTVTMVKE